MNAESSKRLCLALPSSIILTDQNPHTHFPDTTMAPTATNTNSTTTNGKHEVVKNKNGASAGSNGNVHLSSADVIQLEHEYGAHK